MLAGQIPREILCDSFVHATRPAILAGQSLRSSRAGLFRAPPVDSLTIASVYVEFQQEMRVGENKSDVLQGTLDLMVLKTLEAIGTLHGYGIARRIEQVSGDELTLNQGTIYPALLRLEQRGWIKSEWGTSETNRRAKFYSLSRIGRKKIEEETENWERVAATMARFLSQAN
jgi:PadR family transcriptional regulator, regulatory protein PadR